MLDLALALGLGGLAALLVVGLPPLFAVAVAAVLAVLAVVSRVDVRAMADALLLLTSFLIPMNRLYLGASGFPMADFVLLMATGLYILIRLRSAEQRHEVRTYRTAVIGLSVIAVGAFIGALFEVPGPFMYEPTGLEIRDISGWGYNIGNLGKFLLGSMIPLLAFALARPEPGVHAEASSGAFLLGCVVSAFIGGGVPVGPPRRPGHRRSPCTPTSSAASSLLAMGPALAFLLAQRRMRPWALVRPPDPRATGSSPAALARRSAGSWCWR